jgi:riboflavin synthase
MFTGIITDIGRVRALDRRVGGDARVDIGTSYDGDAIALGSSIACSGVCLTVVDRTADSFRVDASNETMARTTLGEWQPDTRVNLERALKVGDELGGHMVSGHVDGIADVVAVEPDGDSRRIHFEVPRALRRFIAEKGSIAIDGVSLTVNNVSGDSFDVNIIPFTADHTTLGSIAAGDRVNVEIDMLARYVARLGEGS